MNLTCFNRYTRCLFLPESRVCNISGIKCLLWVKAEVPAVPGFWQECWKHNNPARRGSCSTHVYELVDLNHCHVRVPGPGHGVLVGAEEGEWGLMWAPLSDGLLRWCISFSLAGSADWDGKSVLRLRGCWSVSWLMRKDSKNYRKKRSEIWLHRVDPWCLSVAFTTPVYTGPTYMWTQTSVLGLTVLH